MGMEALSAMERKLAAAKEALEAAEQIVMAEETPIAALAEAQAQTINCIGDWRTGRVRPGGIHSARSIPRRGDCGKNATRREGPRACLSCDSEGGGSFNCRLMIID